MIGVSQVATKRLLVGVSHAVEQFALAGGGEPTVVIALFQKLSYFEREVHTYSRIAATGALCLVGVVEDLPPVLPPGIRHVLLGAHEPLAREWSVTVLSPTAGATLVANDRETVSPDAPTLESGREFVGGWSFRREDAYSEVLRLRAVLGPRIDAGARAELDDVLRRVVSAPGEPAERRHDAALRHLVSIADAVGTRQAVLERRHDQQAARGPERDARTGLYNEDYLRRWLAGSAAGTLPLGLVLMQVHGLADLRGRYGPRAELAAGHVVGDALHRHLGPADRAVSLGGNTFLAMLPAGREPEMHRFHDRMTESLAMADQRFPFVPLEFSAAATITRDRPLPVSGLARSAAACRPEDAFALLG